MATRKTQKKSQAKIDYKDWVWVIDNLSKDQLVAYDADVEKWTDDGNHFQIMIEDGFQVTVKPDLYNNCIQATAVCQLTGYDNSGLAISARSDKAPDALGILFYKYLFVAERDLRGFADKKPKGVRG